MLRQLSQYLYDHGEVHIPEIGTIKRTYEKVKTITLDEAQFQEYRGEFYSPELDTRYQLSVKDSTLNVKIPRRDEWKLSPFKKDMFTGNVSILFSRDKANKINGFFLTAGRVRNLYFEKIRTK